MADCPEPGIYPGKPDVEYRAWPAANQSLVKLLDPSHGDTHGVPAKAKWEMEHRGLPSASMEMGSALHVRVFRPQEWDVRVGLSPTKTHAQAWKDAKAETPWRALLNQDETDAVCFMADEVCQHPVYRDMLAVGDDLLTEVAVVSDLKGFYPTTHLHGDAGGTPYVVLAKGLLDWWIGRIGWYVDLKSTDDASDDGFRSSVYRYGYGFQVAYYERLLEERGLQMMRPIFLVVENVPPYLVAARELEPQAWNSARRKVDELLPYWAWCTERNQWPGHDERITMTGYPEWVYRREE